MTFARNPFLRAFDYQEWCKTGVSYPIFGFFGVAEKTVKWGFSGTRLPEFSI